MSVEIHETRMALVPGQLWRIENGYILISDYGKRLVGYKKLRKPNQRAVITQLIRPEALLKYLSEVGAELMLQSP
jgi:hypothetical protein